MDKAEMQELDVWLAENVMKYKPHPSGVPHWFCRWEGDFIEWHPTTNIVQAWQVLEKITEPPKTVEMAKRMVNTRFAAWFDKARLWAMTAQEAALEISVNAKKAWEAK